MPDDRRTKAVNQPAHETEQIRLVCADGQVRTFHLIQLFADLALEVFDTPAELATYLGVSEGDLANWAGGSRQPDTDVARLLIDLHFVHIAASMDRPAAESDRWLRTHHVELGATPLEAIRQGRTALAYTAARARTARTG